MYHTGPGALTRERGQPDTMSEFPGLDKWYLSEAEVLDCQNVAMWQMVPGPVARMAAPATLRVALWTGRVVELDGIGRRVTVADVLERLFDGEAELSAAPRDLIRLAVDGRVVAASRSALACFDGAPEGASLDHLVDPDGALRCNLIIEPCPKVALGVRRLAPFVAAAAKESKEDSRHVLEMARARVRFAIPPKRKAVVPNHFRQDSADAEPWGSIMRFENFMKARSVHRGNHAKLRPLRSGRWKSTFPGMVPISHRWHEKEHVKLEGRSADPSTVAAIYRPFVDARRTPKKAAAPKPKKKGVWTAEDDAPPVEVDSADEDDTLSSSTAGRRVGAFHGVKHFEEVAKPEKMIHRTKEKVIPATKQVFVEGKGFVTVEIPEDERVPIHDPDVVEAYHEGRISKF